MLLLQRKKTFILLEIALAFALISLSILPFLRYPYQHMKKELELFFAMELEKVAKEELAKIYVDLNKRVIPAKFLFSPTLCKTQINKESETIEVHLCSGMKQTFRKKVHIYWQRQKLEGQTLTALINVSLAFSPLNNPKKNILHVHTQIVAKKKD